MRHARRGRGGARFPASGWVWSICIAGLSTLAGCGGDDPEPSLVNGGGVGGINPAGGMAGIGGINPGGSSSGGAGGFGAAAGNGGNCNPRATGTLRDFKAFSSGAGHPDFETFTGPGEDGLVESTLGSDHKPVFAHTGSWEATQGQGRCERDNQQNVRCVTTPESFDQWYRNVDGVNQAIEFTVPFTVTDGIATYDNSSFFPLDGQAFGNEDRNHNFHFTFELHMEFLYSGGEEFSFTGDDDLWVFINNRLAIDLGGLHSALSEVINLNDRAAELGITPGNVYPLDFFHAERHTSASNFKIQSTLRFTNCNPIVY